MAISKAKLFAIGAPVLAGGAVLATASPAFADGPAETTSLTAAHINAANQTVTCTLTLTLTTKYQNDNKRGSAGWSITNSPGCRDATIYQSVSWVTPSNGSGGTNDFYGDGAPGTVPVPASTSDAYSPLNPTVSSAQFSEYVSVSFDDCINNCSMFLSLTADGKA
jgi:hypothetical protein